MSIATDYVKSTRGHYPKQGSGKMTHCVHCYLPLETGEDGSGDLESVEGHECPESLLAKQPAAPVPFN